MINLLADISNSIKQGAKDITEGAKNILSTIFPEENDDGKGNNVSSGIAEDLTEGLAKVVNILDEGIKAGSRALSIPSIADMMDEIQGEYELADRVCDVVGGQSGQIPIPILPDVTICVAPKQVEWALQPENFMKTIIAGGECLLEKNITEPVDFYPALFSLVGEDVEKLVGWTLGFLAGEGAPDVVLPFVLHPLSLHTPFAFGACVQSKIAKEMGDLTQQKLDQMEADIKKFTKRDKGIAKSFIKGLTGGTGVAIKGIQENIEGLAKNLGL